jgi:N-acyl amino acid synthase of PEP-CTERM/exosortase system
MFITALDNIGFMSAYRRHFDIIRADTAALLDRVYRLRYQVYCIENPFEDPTQNLDGREIDSDDDRAAHVLLIHRKSGNAVGTARIIFPDPSQRPLPIQHLLDPEYRSLFSRLPLRATGEISRFAISKALRRRLGESFTSAQARSAEQRVMPFISLGLGCGILGICLESGISHIAAVMEPTLIRLLNRRFGLDVRSIGGLVEYHGSRQPCVACVHDLITQLRSGDSFLGQYIDEKISSHRNPMIASINRVSP